MFPVRLSRPIRMNGRSQRLNNVDEIAYFERRMSSSNSKQQEQ